MLNTMSKIRGQVKSPGYPQSEGLLGECMIRYGKELGEDSNFGECPLALSREERGQALGGDRLWGVSLTLGQALGSVPWLWAGRGQAPGSLLSCHPPFWKGL